MQNDLEAYSKRLIDDLNSPHLDQHRNQKDRLEKYDAPRNRFNRWRDSEEGKAWKQQQFEAIESKCPECEFTLPSIGHFVIDHIKPLGKYPHMATDPGNLRLLCHLCNLTKGSTV